MGWTEKGSLKGPKGDKGDRGADGVDGADGTVIHVSAQLPGTLIPGEFYATTGSTPL